MRFRHFALGLLVLAVASPKTRAQACFDDDADGSVFGVSCPSSADCMDLSWSRHPGAPDLCDGFDNDCDGDPDTGGCDRNCESPFLFADTLELTNEGAPTEAASAAACSVLTDSGLLVVVPRVYREPGHPDSHRLFARLYARNGEPLGPSFAVGEPEIVDPWERRCVLADAGDRVVLVWQDGHTRDQSTHRLVARVLDALGRPLSSPVDLTANMPVGSGTWIYHTADWDGDRFGVFWVPSPRRYLLASFLSKDGAPAQPLTRVVTDAVTPSAATIQEVTVRWTGQKYQVALWHDGIAPDSNVRMLTTDREGTLILNRFIGAYAGNLSLAQGPDRIALFFSEAVTPATKVKVLFTDLDGNYMPVPGTKALMQVSSNLAPSTLKSGWTGVHFTANQQTREAFTYRQHFFRVLPDGTNLDPGGRLLAQGGDHRTFHGMHWSGAEWLYLENRQGTEPRIHLERIVCSCADLDGDSYDACALRDCDDASPAAHPGGSEVCTGLRDEDCDGLSDCADPDCPGTTPPANPSDLRWDGTLLRWTAPAGSQRFDLARGRLSDVGRRGDLLQSECPGFELTGSQWADDGRIPAPGDGLWYLIRAEGAPCSLAGWGAGTPSRDVKACH